MYVLAQVTISRCSKPAAAAGYKPAPQLGLFIGVSALRECTSASLTRHERSRHH